MTFEDLWYGHHPLSWPLLPLSGLFCAGVKLRRQAYQFQLLKSHRAKVPVIVVGNITVGGTGKTPLVIWLAQFFKIQGFKPGLVSRGYGGQVKKWPQPVWPNSDPYLVGDEPVLLARQTDSPVVVAPRRGLAVHYLLENYPCDLIISDDGLQHYALHREIEIAVVDSQRRYGNGRCLPAGPLREPISRLNTVDFIVSKGTPVLSNEYAMQYDIQPLRRVIDDGLFQPLSALRGQTVHAVAGIGYTHRFFALLQENGLNLHCHPFPDHHHYGQSDLDFKDNWPVIMTEKDAIKCRSLAKTQHYYLPIKAQLPDSFAQQLRQRL